MKRFIANSKTDCSELKEKRTHFYEEINKAVEYFPAQINEKVWGNEVSIGYEPYYTVKLMTITPGYQCSIHSHSFKTESFYLISGKLTVETINTKTGITTITNLTEGFDNITILPNTPHRFYCADDNEVKFIEVSTAEYTDDNNRFAPSGPRAKPTE